jgi:hypothetical protein
MKLTDYIIEKAGKHFEYLFIGVDDSHPDSNIQANEMRYINQKIKEKNYNNMSLFAAADELGLMCFARAAALVYGKAEVKLRYFGDAEKLSAGEFDFATLEDCTNAHMAALNVVETKNAPLEILMITRENKIKTDDAAAMLVQQLKNNIANQIPTIVIEPDLPNFILQNEMVKENVPLSELIGYSNWNTAANAMGIAMTMGITRYLYLKNTENPAINSHAAFLKGLTFGIIKDIVYIRDAKQRIHIHMTQEEIHEQMMGKGNPIGAENLLKRINESGVIVSLKPYRTEKLGTASIGNYYFPMERTFEMGFDVKLNTVSNACQSRAFTV